MNGILLIDKGKDWTSNDVVCKLKGILHERRIGHSGTLDPMATGLLCVFVGRATRAVSFSEAHDKRYAAEITFGIETDTQDSTGNVLRRDSRLITRRELEKVLPAFTGDILQTPPMYSALKINGERLYKMARAGISVEREPRPVTVYSIEITGNPVPGRFTLDIRCSKGTYIRSLCHDIGAALGSCAVMSALRRVEIGPFNVADAHTIGEIQKLSDSGEDPGRLLLPVSGLFDCCDKLTVNPAAEKKIRNGNGFDISAPDGKYTVFSNGGEFLALAAVQAEHLTVIKSFYEV